MIFLIAHLLFLSKISTFSNISGFECKYQHQDTNIMTLMFKTFIVMTLSVSKLSIITFSVYILSVMKLT